MAKKQETPESAAYVPPPPVDIQSQLEPRRRPQTPAAIGQRRSYDPARSIEEDVRGSVKAAVVSAVDSEIQVPQDPTEDVKQHSRALTIEQIKAEMRQNTVAYSGVVGGVAGGEPVKTESREDYEAREARVHAETVDLIKREMSGGIRARAYSGAEPGTEPETPAEE